MARNAEKAMTTLARWRAAQVMNEGEVKQRRPFLASECTDLPQAEKWRIQIIREIARKVSQIQNAGLGEFRIRDLNDEINKLLREKGHWEAQIRELGGPDYSATGPKMLDHEGKEVPGNRGYKYFGAARQLPGVRELFEQAPPPPPRKTRAELMKNIDADYYGYRDDDDGLLAPSEHAEEAKATEKSIAEWKIKKERSTDEADGREEMEEEEEEEENIYFVEPEESSDEECESGGVAIGGGGVGVVVPGGGKMFTAHVPVPTQKDIEAALLAKKKQELLARYCPEDDDKEDDNDGEEQQV